jgi:hypothetical protein
VEWIVVVFGRRRLQPQRLTHRGEEALDRVDGGRNLATLDTADSRLIGTGSQRQPALTQMVSPACLLYQL